MTVPSSYPTTLTQSVNVKFDATAAGQTKVMDVTVKKGGTADANSRVELTGGPFGVYLYGTTNGSGRGVVHHPGERNGGHVHCELDEHVRCEGHGVRHQRLDKHHVPDRAHGEHQLMRARIVKRLRDHRGFTLVELVVAMPIMLVVMGGLVLLLTTVMHWGSQDAAEQTTLQRRRARR